MGHRFADIAFTDSVKAAQEANGSRANYAAWEDGPDFHHKLGEKEASFISQRDSFYMASVSETGWPYVQHRGGPIGFIKLLNDASIGFADFGGNRQYISVGNVAENDRVSLFFMDYPNRMRLKLLGRTRLVQADDVEMISRLSTPDYRGRVERGFIISVTAYDWNCSQHITPRYTKSQYFELNKKQEKYDE